MTAEEKRGRDFRVQDPCVPARPGREDVQQPVERLTGRPLPDLRAPPTPTGGSGKTKRIYFVMMKQASCGKKKGDGSRDGADCRTLGVEPFGGTGGGRQLLLEAAARPILREGKAMKSGHPTNAINR